jgi:nucleotide-binding universal stress UspA family protein
LTAEYLVLATDLSTRCDRALDRALRLAREWSLRLVIVHALPATTTADEQPSWRGSDPLESARRHILANVGPTPGLTIDIVVERRVHPVDLVLEAASQPGCALIVTGVAREETISRMLLGTTLEALARRSPVPVLEVKQRPHEDYRHIVVATDFSAPSRRALEVALERFPAARLTLLHGYRPAHESHSVDTTAARDTARREAIAQSQEFIAAIPGAQATLQRIEQLCEYGDPGMLLADMAEARPLQLVVLGTAGRSGLAGLVLGSTAIRIAAEVPADILLVRQASA